MYRTLNPEEIQGNYYIFRENIDQQVLNVDVDVPGLQPAIK